MNTAEWQPITGCGYASPGCSNCKTLALAGPALQAEFRQEGLVHESKNGPTWNGKTHLAQARLAQPLALFQSTYIFVCPHGDIFHPNVPSAWVDLVFDVMEKCRRHVYALLTKRAARQRDYLLQRYAGALAPSHIWLGVSCERQQELDERVPLLLLTPTNNRYLTLYPVLGPMDIRSVLASRKLHQVFAGTEAERPADPAWVHTLAQQCAAAGVPFINSSRLVGS